MNHAASAPAWMCAWSIWAFSAVMITSVAEHTHAGDHKVKPRGRSTWVTDEAWITQCKEGRGKEKLPQPIEKKNRLLKMEGNQSHYVPGTLLSKKKKIHIFEIPSISFYWNTRFRTGIFAMALLFTIETSIYKVNPTTAEVISRRASGISDKSCSTVWTQQLRDQQRTRSTTQINVWRLVKHGNCSFFLIVHWRSNFHFQLHFKVSYKHWGEIKLCLLFYSCVRQSFTWHLKHQKNPSTNNL